MSVDRQALDERIVEYLYGDYEESQRLELRAEIDADDALRAQLHQWLEVEALLENLPEEEPNPQIAHVVMAAARAEAQPPTSSVWTWLRQLSAAPAFAAIFLFVVGGGLLLELTGQFEDAAPESTSSKPLDEQMVEQVAPPTSVDPKDSAAPENLAVKTPSSQAKTHEASPGIPQVTDLFEEEQSGLIIGSAAGSGERRVVSKGQVKVKTVGKRAKRAVRTGSMRAKKAKRRPRGKSAAKPGRARRSPKPVETTRSPAPPRQGALEPVAAPAPVPAPEKAASMRADDLSPPQVADTRALDGAAALDGADFSGGGLGRVAGAVQSGSRKAGSRSAKRRAPTRFEFADAELSGEQRERRPSARSAGRPAPSPPTRLRSEKGRSARPPEPDVPPENIKAPEQSAAFLLEDDGDGSDAPRGARTASQAAPSQKTAFNLRSQADRVRGQGRCRAAVPLYERYLKLSISRGDRQSALMALGECYEALGSNDRAVRAYQKVVALGGPQAVKASRAILRLGSSSSP